MKRKEQINSFATDKLLGLGPAFSESEIQYNNGYMRGLMEGAEWADDHPNLTWEDIRKICLIAENVHKYYGFWTQTVYEEILDRFCKPEIWT